MELVCMFYMDHSQRDKTSHVMELACMFYMDHSQRNKTSHIMELACVLDMTIPKGTARGEVKCDKDQK